MNNSTLWKYHTEYQSMPEGLKFLLKEKLKNFYSINKRKLEAIANHTSGLQKEYLVVEDGKIVMDESKDVKTAMGTHKSEIPKMQEGKTLEEFQQKVNEFMNQEAK